MARVSLPSRLLRVLTGEIVAAEVQRQKRHREAVPFRRDGALQGMKITSPPTMLSMRSIVCFKPGVLTCILGPAWDLGSSGIFS